MNKIAKFFKSIFCSVNGEQPKLKTLYQKQSTKSVISSLICILVGILVGFLVMVIFAFTSEEIENSDAFIGLSVVLGGPFSSQQNVSFILGDMLFRTTPLLLTGLSVAVAFKTGLFNIGAPGQYLMGAMVSIAIALGIPVESQFQGFLVWLLALVCGGLMGALWGAIPGAFKALLNVNEVIVCIMTNWIAANVVSWFFSVNKQFTNMGAGKSAYTIPTSKLGVATPKLGLDKIFKGSYMDIGLFIAIAVAIIIYIILNKTTFGYELKACGHNRNAAQYAGMKGKRNIVLSMVIAGALSALGASLYYLNGATELYWDTYLSLPSDGFNGIPVALLASNNPIGVIFSALFLRYIEKGGYLLSSFTMFNEHVSSLIIAIIVYFAGFARLINDMLSRNRKSGDKGLIGRLFDKIKLPKQGKNSVKNAELNVENSTDNIKPLNGDKSLQVDAKENK